MEEKKKLPKPPPFKMKMAPIGFAARKQPEKVPEIKTEEKEQPPVEDTAVDEVAVEEVVVEEVKEAPVEEVVVEEIPMFPPTVQEESPVQQEHDAKDYLDSLKKGISSLFAASSEKEEVKAKEEKPVEKIPVQRTKPVKLKRKIQRQDRIEFRAGQGKQEFHGSKSSEIILHIEDSKEEWRLFIGAVDNHRLTTEAGKRVFLPADADFAKGALYDRHENIIPVDLGDEFVFSENSYGWKMFYLSLKEVFLRDVSTYDLDGRSGVLVGPQSSSLVFFDSGKLTVKRKISGEYKRPTYDFDIDDLKDKEEYFCFSVYSENGFFNGDDKVGTLCLETEGGSSYGWNVSFKNGLFMSVADVIEYQHRNGKLPDSAGTLYRGAHRLKFSGLKKLIVYNKPYYYNYSAV